jgi:hypothetical protein
VPYTPPVPQVVDETENLPKMVQGTTVDSQEEARVAVALDGLKWEYKYQVPFMGGVNVRGGTVIDFVILNRGILPIPLFVNGEYWHAGRRAAEDEIRMALLEKSGWYDVPVVLWANEIPDVPTTKAILKERIG